MDGQTTFLDEFNATAPDLSREVNVIVYGGSTPGPTPGMTIEVKKLSFNKTIINDLPTITNISVEVG